MYAFNVYVYMYIRYNVVNIRWSMLFYIYIYTSCSWLALLTSMKLKNGSDHHLMNLIAGTPGGNSDKARMRSRSSWRNSGPIFNILFACYCHTHSGLKSLSSGKKILSSDYKASKIYNSIWSPASGTGGLVQPLREMKTPASSWFAAFEVMCIYLYNYSIYLYNVYSYLCRMVIAWNFHPAKLPDNLNAILMQSVFEYPYIFSRWTWNNTVVQRTPWCNIYGSSKRLEPPGVYRTTLQMGSILCQSEVPKASYGYI